MKTMKENYTARTMQRLLGLLEGISSDYVLRDAEVTNLNNWLQMHEAIKYEPFNELRMRLGRILADGIIDEDEKQELIDWCFECSDDYSLSESTKTLAVRRLHGFLHGIIIDDVLSDEEIYNLSDWLEDYEAFRDVWPFCDLYYIVSKILEDGVIDEAERSLLKKVCTEFSEKPIDGAVIHDDLYNELGDLKNKVFQPIQSIAEKGHEIFFPSSLFCFTGPAKIAKRTDLVKVIMMMGGEYRGDVSSVTHYLIVGGYSSPAWVYSTYGRKIEKALRYKKKGFDVKIIMEDDFINQVPGDVIEKCIGKV